jgi:hypothetical protein
MICRFQLSNRYKGWKTIIKMNNNKTMKMKMSVKIMGMLLILLMGSISGSLYAQRGIRSVRDTLRMNRPGRGVDIRPERYRQRLDSIMPRGFRPYYQPGWIGPGRQFTKPGSRFGMRGFNWSGPMFGFGRGMGPIWMDRPVRGRIWRDRPLIEKIPGLTEKQKEEISDLLKKQQEEMQKLRDETGIKMNELRKAHREKIMNLLNEEQKK